MELKTFLANLDIIQALSPYVVLKAYGGEYRGLCPFHQEKTPSFYVSPSKKVYYCFSCHKAGNIITFLKEKEMMTFQDIIAHFQNFYHVQLEVGSSKAFQEPNDLFLDVHKKVHDFFVQALTEPAGTHVRAYLKKRGFSQDIPKKFALGYGGAPHQLKTLFANDPDALKELPALGLDSLNHRGSHLFVHRLIFPILDRSGRTIAFGGRVLPQDSAVVMPQAKYINSLQSPIFSKRQVLYGFYQALPRIKKDRTVLICEGYLDVLSFHQLGVDYAVAPLGTSLTTEHLTLLTPYIKTLVLCFDQDTAGYRAFVKALELAFSLGITQIFVCDLSPYKDVSVCLETQEGAFVLHQLKQMKTGFQFFLEEHPAFQANLKGFYDMAPAIYSLLSIVKENSPLLFDQYLVRIAHSFFFNLSTVKKEVSKNLSILSRQRQGARIYKTQKFVLATKQIEDVLEEHLLWQLVGAMEHFPFARRWLTEEDFVDKVSKRIFRSLEEAYKVPERRLSFQKDVSVTWFQEFQKRGQQNYGESSFEQIRKLVDKLLERNLKHKITLFQYLLRDPSVFEEERRQLGENIEFLTRQIQNKGV